MSGVEILVAPLRALVAALGTGVLPAGGVDAALGSASQRLEQAAELSARTGRQAVDGWRGRAGTAATALAERAATEDRALADQAVDYAAVVQTAADRVRRANTELNGLVDSFVASASAVAPTLSPATLAALLPVAAAHLQRGLAVVQKTQAELAGDAARLGRTPAPAEVTVAGGGRIPITLPDGSVAYAPDARAAAAVRAALSQRGTPYVWGGTAPGGFDCSGLTQWAYRQAGLELPRLAQDQDTAGYAVARSELRPGDLAVWSGHVAMYVGNGQMVEAGDPVQVSPVRTTNLDQTFEGFYRPR